ncbi:anti-ECFsigma factor, ChrR [Anaeromyxobacter dehalogenans 2CP-1]|uniref:Anti-ECFsigma factor, ChrR n=1 Tax=Anaeromyxobacter dehalogenans (strain ATCC BAA-258 / DSM 21875 / 2CP-1) TaxID=455488 RepID=B8J5W0_ANAD2|nr:anti-ECF sigma factor ChrR [Anaeromyxobacter dehalogenans]ACL65057.1 anti-ECFsigma factor, ChrR [Anaeromyxobacter dehalogenans 2CP-1]
MTHEPNHPDGTDHLPWAEVSPGFSLKLLRGSADGDTRALLLRLEPGTLVPRHRHEDEVHALNLAGHRKLLDTGEVVGPGGYVYEPPGNVDSWMAVGDEPVVVFVTVRGAMETLDPQGGVAERSTTAGIAAFYRGVLAGRGADR